MEVNWRNKLPCLIVFRRSCHLKFCFRTQEGRRFAVCFSTGEERDPCFLCEDRCLLTGQFWAPKLPVINYFPPSWSPVMSSTVPVGMPTPDQDRGASAAPCFTARVQFAVWNSGRGVQRCSLGSEGRSKQQQHTPLSWSFLWSVL